MTTGTLQRLEQKQETDKKKEENTNLRSLEKQCWREYS